MYKRVSTFLWRNDYPWIYLGNLFNGLRSITTQRSYTFIFQSPTKYVERTKPTCTLTLHPYLGWRNAKYDQKRWESTTFSPRRTTFPPETTVHSTINILFRFSKLGKSIYVGTCKKFIIIKIIFKRLWNSDKKHYCTFFLCRMYRETYIL